jgi:glycolate oxidase
MNAPESLLPPVDRARLQSRIVAALAEVLPVHAVLHTPEDTTPYECDGLTAYRQRPLCVALPETDAQVQQVLKVCHRLGVPVVARGAGTGLSGGAMPHAEGVTLSMAKFNRIVSVDAHTRTAVASVACAIWPFPRRPRLWVFTTRRILPARSPAPSGAMWQKTRAASIASSTG